MENSKIKREGQSTTLLTDIKHHVYKTKHA